MSYVLKTLTGYRIFFLLFYCFPWLVSSIHSSPIYLSIHPHFLIPPLCIFIRVFLYLLISLSSVRPYFFPSINPSIYTSFLPFLRPSILSFLSTPPPFRSTIYASLHLSTILIFLDPSSLSFVHLSFPPFISPSVCPSVLTSHPSVVVFFFQCVCLSVWVFWISLLCFVLLCFSRQPGCTWGTGSETLFVTAIKMTTRKAVDRPAEVSVCDQPNT